MSDSLACSFFHLQALVPETISGFTALGQRLLPRGLDIRSIHTMIGCGSGGEPLFRDCNAQIVPGAGIKGADLLLYGGEALPRRAPLSLKMQAHMIHEFGHLAVPLDETSLGKDGLLARAFRGVHRFFRPEDAPVLMGRPWRRRLFYSEQAAVTFDSVVKALADNPSKRIDVYLKLRQIRNGRPAADVAGPSFDSQRDNGAVYPDIEPYDNFSLYTLNPLARFYGTEAGRRDARARYIDAWGLAYERIAQDIDALPVFFRRHLRAMQIFADAADELAARRGGGQPDVALKLWWRGLREAMKTTEQELSPTFYAGEPVSYGSREEAMAAFESLQASLDAASAARPGDRLLRRMAKRFSKAMADPTPPPRYVPALKALTMDRTF